MKIKQELSVHDALTVATGKLRDAGFSTPELDARLLLSAATGWSSSRIFADPALKMLSSDNDCFQSFIERRLKAEPVFRIIGLIEFYGREFAVSPNVLLPRRDSETLIDVVLNDWPDRNAAFDILDIGTGTGILGITLASEYPNSRVTASDVSAKALEVAKKNAIELGVAERVLFVESDLLDKVPGSFDIIVSNPPYIKSGVIASLEADVRKFDPRLALDGGQDGLKFYRAIFSEAGSRLKEGGMIYLEIGFDQAASVSQIAAATGFDNCRILQDLDGNDRVLAAKVEI